MIPVISGNFKIRIKRLPQSMLADFIILAVSLNALHFSCMSMSVEVNRDETSVDSG